MKKYKIKTVDTSLLWLTPFAFLNMDGTTVYQIKEFHGFWIFGKWEVIYKTKHIYDAYEEYFKLKYNIELEEYRNFPHNRKKNQTVCCRLHFKYDTNTKDYIVGYKPDRYYKFYHCQSSKDSYEDALLRLITDLQIKDMINQNKEL